MDFTLFFVIIVCYCLSYCWYRQFRSISCMPSPLIIDPVGHWQGSFPNRQKINLPLLHQQLLKLILGVSSFLLKVYLFNLICMAVWLMSRQFFAWFTNQQINFQLWGWWCCIILGGMYVWLGQLVWSWYFTFFRGHILSYGTEQQVELSQLGYRNVPLHELSYYY